MSEPPEIKPSYLIRGTDAAKIDSALSRLRARAERESGEGALQSFSSDGSGAADPTALLAELPAMSLIASRRYLLAEGAERWTPSQAKPVAEALAGLPPDTTVVLIGRIDPGADSRARAKAAKTLDSLASAVEKHGGSVLSYDAPKVAALPRHLVAEAERRGFTLETEAARSLVERMGESTQRLTGELDRLALYAGEGGTVDLPQLEAMIADTSEEVAWNFSDALVDQDPAAALAAAERLEAQGDSVTALVYQAAKRLREARMAVAGLEAGRSARELEASLPMHPYAAKLLLRRVQNADSAAMRSASCAVADLEWWTRGGSDYPEDVALTLAVRRASGG
jgi:DNA polymerase III delta subunit